MQAKLNKSTGQIPPGILYLFYLLLISYFFHFTSWTFPTSLNVYINFILMTIQNQIIGICHYLFFCIPNI